MWHVHMATGISAVAEAALKAGRLAQGIEVKLADGQPLRGWGRRSNGPEGNTPRLPDYCLA